MQNIKYLAFITLLLSACGGGSSGSGLLIEGTLTEAGGAVHKSLHLKHSSGQRIENVQICALGECSISDQEGQWGFVINGFAGGSVLFDISGHGIEAETIVEIPANTNEVVIDFNHVAGGTVEASHVTLDGDTIHNESHDQHEDQQDAEHDSSEHEHE